VQKDTKPPSLAGILKASEREGDDAPVMSRTPRHSSSETATAYHQLDRFVLESLDTDSGGLALLWITLLLKGHLLTIIQGTQTGALDRTDVNENVGTAAVWLNEPESLCGVEPLHSTVRHLFLQL
jgi:hypothetical protein